MAKLNNEQARRKVDGDYNGRWNEGKVFDLVDMERVDLSWEFYDKDDERWIKDSEGNVVGRINW